MSFFFRLVLMSFRYPRAFASFTEYHQCGYDDLAMGEWA